MANDIASRTLFCILVELSPVLVPITGGAQSSWDLYRPGKLSEIVVRERSGSLASAHGIREATIVAGQKLGVQARVTYTGQLRALSSAHRRIFKEWRTVVGLPSSADAMFTKECLFREDTLSLWLPVQEAVLEHLIAELKPGDVVDIFAAYVGAQRVGRAFDWLFVVNEYRTHP